MSFWWRDAAYREKIKKAALDGIEEWADAKAVPQAKQDCPVDQGILQESIGTERSDSELCVYVGCGGPASDYALRQELDRSLNHTVGKAGFIRDSVEMHAGELKSFVSKRVK